MFLKRLSQKGFTLVEVLVGVGISASLALLAAKLISDQQFNQNHLRVSADVDKRHAIIQSAIKNQKACNDTFAGINLDDNATNEISIPRLIKDNGAAGITNIAVPDIDDANWKSTTSDFRIKSLILRNPLANSTYYEMRGNIKELVVTYELKRKYFGDTIVTKPIHLFMTMDAGGTFRECGSILSDTKAESMYKMCQALGTTIAEWIEPADYAVRIPPAELAAAQANYPNGKCQVIESKCAEGTAPIKIDSLGGFICHPVSSRLDDLGSKIDTSTHDCVGKTNLSITTDASGRFTISCPY